MVENSAMTAPVAFRRRRSGVRTAALVASSGILAGLGASPAMAATALDCDGGNTVDASTGDGGDIQTLLDANTPIVCLSGTFSIATTLTFDHDLTLFGLDAAQLDGGNAVQILAATDSASLTVQNLAFVNGFADASNVDGGAILVQGNLRVENSTFTGNQAREDGGAIYVRDDVDAPLVQIIDSTFTNNSTGEVVDGFGGYSGGAIYAEGESDFLQVSGSTFAGNEASEFGGAIFAYGMFVERSTFDSNTALGGGAVYGAAIAAFESTFADNSAELGAPCRASSTRPRSARPSSTTTPTTSVARSPPDSPSSATYRTGQ